MILTWVTTFLLIMYLPFGISQRTCDACKDCGGFEPWTSWSSCLPKNNDGCHKVQTRTSSRGFFCCPECSKNDERRCQQCEHNCDSGKCSCKHGYQLDKDQLGCSLLSCSPLKVGNCPSNSYKDNNGDVCQKVDRKCTNSDLFTSKCSFVCSQGFGLAVLSSLNNRQYFGEFLNESDFSSVKNEISCILDGNNKLVWGFDTSNYYCRRLNDAPRNLKLSNRRVDEHLPVNSIVGSFSSFHETDVVYMIESSEGSTFFNILGDKLRTSKPFSWKDFNKANASLSLLIKVMDKTATSFYMTKSFDIEIVNIDDPPQNVDISNTEFDDLTEVDRVIGNLTAEDIDQKPSQRSGSYSWRLLAYGPYVQHFKIVGNTLILNKQFTTKNEDFLTNIKVRCTEDTDNKKYTDKEFTLHHKNVNNPVQIQFLDINPIPESTPVNSTVGRIVVIDGEGDLVKIHDLSELKARATFMFTRLECTKVNGKTNCSSDIVLSSPLDYEQVTEYDITVEAVDEHNEKSSLGTKLKVTNVNEKPTSIEFDKAELSVPEGSSKGYLVGTITVFDEDFNIKACSITNSQSPFEINAFSIVVKDDNLLNFEEKNSYTVNIRCVDDGGLAVENQTQILVTDVNEVPGNPCTSLTSIDHKTIAGTIVKTLDAVDPDNEVYPKQKVTFELVSNNVPFVLNGSSLVTSGDLQSGYQYVLDVKAHDDGVLMQHVQGGGLKKYIGTQAERIYQCNFKTSNSDPCDKYHEYKNGLCQCKEQLTGLKCDRNKTRCKSNSCGITGLCSTFVQSPQVCIERSFQISMLLPISSNKFADQTYRNNLEAYIESILEGNVNGKTLQSVEGSSKRRKRRSTGDDFYIEIGEQISIKGSYTYVHSIPYLKNTDGSSYELVDATSLCAKFDGTDIRCLNAQDCEILKTAGIACSPEEGAAVNGGETEETSGTAVYTYIVPITIAVLIAIVILVLLFIRRHRSPKQDYPEEPVVFNNQKNNLEYPPKPLNTEQSSDGQTMTDIERNRRLTDLNRFDSRVFQENQNNGSPRTIDPNTVNYRENRAYVEDAEHSNNLSPQTVANPLYASIGKAANNPLYQSSVKDKNNVKRVDSIDYDNNAHVVDLKGGNNAHNAHVVDLKSEHNAHVVDLVDEQMAKEKEYAMVDDVADPVLRTIRRGGSLNVFTPEKDDETEDKTFKKLNIDSSEA